MACVHDESFGPVLTVETFRDEDEAVRIANDTEYGLAGGVFTGDAGRAQRVAGRLRHGTVWINDFHPYVPQAEWGGMKHSGNGRELGPTGLEEYRETKHIWHNIDPNRSTGSPARALRPTYRSPAVTQRRPTTTNSPVRLQAGAGPHRSASSRRSLPASATCRS